LTLKDCIREGKCLKKFELAAIGMFMMAAVVVLATNAFGKAHTLLPESPAVSIKAYAYAMPNNGWAPLTVYFSPYGTNAENSRIVLYEWDLDGNGLFESDATNNQGYASYTYTKARDYTISLRVTSEDGGTATAQTIISVRHPASSSVDYWFVFDDTRVRRVDFILTQENWDNMWADPGEKLQVRADAVVFGRQIQDAGLSTKGNSTLWFPGEKKPLKLDINAFLPDQEYKNLKMLLFHNNFGDPSMLREKLSYDLMQFAGIPGNHVAYVEVWLDIKDDDQPATFVGVYSMVERPDRKYLANRFGRDNDDGNLYKADAWFEEGAADFAYYGEHIEDYPKPRGEIAYHLMYKDKEDNSDIINLCRVIDNVDYETPEDFADALEHVFNVDSFLRYLSVIFLTLNFDQYPDTGNNFYVYNNPGNSKFEWISWDMGNSWGNFGGEYDYPIYRNGPSIGPMQYAPLYENVIEVERYQRAYEAYLDLLIRTRFNEEYIKTRAEELHTLILPHLSKGDEDQMYFGENAPSSLEEFATAKDHIVSLTRQRSEFVANYLDDLKKIGN